MVSVLATRVARTLTRAGVLLVGLQVVFLALLFAAQTVPDDPIVEHLVEAVDDGLYGPSQRPDGMGGTATSFTECVALGTGLGRPDAGAWDRTMRMPRIGSCAAGREQLPALARGEGIDGVSDYFRYWSGWTVVMRPVLALWGLGPLRMISGALLAAAAVSASMVLTRRVSMAFVAALTLPLVVASNILSTPSTAAQAALAFAATFAGVALTAVGASRGLSSAVAGTIVGAAVFNYVDVLSTPAIPWMLSSVVAGAVALRGGGSTAATARTVGVVALTWIVSFGFTWGARWLIAIVAVGWEDAADVIFDKVGFRIGGDVGGAGDADPGFGEATRANVRYWLDVIPTAWPVLVAGATIVGIALVAAVRHDRRRVAPFAVLAAPALLGLVWYEALRNHSLIHVPKTYAILPVALGVVIAAAVFVATQPQFEGGDHRTSASAPSDGRVGP